MDVRFNRWHQLKGLTRAHKKVNHPSNRATILIECCDSMIVDVISLKSGMHLTLFVQVFHP